MALSIFSDASMPPPDTAMISIALKQAHTLWRKLTAFIGLPEQWQYIEAVGWILSFYKENQCVAGFIPSDGSFKLLLNFSSEETLRAEARGLSGLQITELTGEGFGANGRSFTFTVHDEGTQKIAEILLSIKLFPKEESHHGNQYI